MAILAAFAVPHPPLIIPAVGRGREHGIQNTIDACDEVARRIAALAPQTIVVSTPHSVMYRDYNHISPGSHARGGFAQFGAGRAVYEADYDQEFVSRLCSIAQRKGLSAGTDYERDPSLDHATMIPLHFIQKHYTRFKLVRIGLSGLSPAEHYKLGVAVQQAASELGRRVVYVASGDLSHKLTSTGPYGYAPEGPKFDDEICRIFRTGDFLGLLTMDRSFADAAAECGLRSFQIMAGALDGIPVKSELLSHEGPFGVGYAVAAFTPVEADGEPATDAPATDVQKVSASTSAAPHGSSTADAVTGHAGPLRSSKADAATGPAGSIPGGHWPLDQSRCFLPQYEAWHRERMAERKAHEDPLVSLARATLETYVREHRRISVPKGLPQELYSRRAGCFVSLKEDGELRGCIGTILPVQSCLAEEIVSNAISAGTHDPRFAPVRATELDELVYSVDVLTEPEPIEDGSQLDPKRYGVIVSTPDGRRGLLLPDLNGIDTVKEQMDIAARKGHIDLREDDVRLQRFEVVRHT